MPAGGGGSRAGVYRGLWENMLQCNTGIAACSMFSKLRTSYYWPNYWPNYWSNYWPNLTVLHQHRPRFPFRIISAAAFSAYRANGEHMQGEDFLGRARLLYRGLGENVFQEALTTGVFLGLYEYLKPRLMMFAPPPMIRALAYFD